MRNYPRVRYTVEHFRAIEAEERPLGVAYVSTGRVDQVDAHDPPAAAAIALSEGEDLMDVDLVSYTLNTLAATYGTLFVAAAGNNGPFVGTALEAPGSASQALSVGATLCQFR